MKRAFFCCLAIWLTVWAAIVPAKALAQPAPPLNIHAEAAALIDVQSGRIIFSRQGDKELPIASLTKIMTAIVAIESGKLSDQVTVSKNAFGKEGSSIYLKLGEKMSLEQMLYGLMLRSGNDAATAIAEHVGGSVEGFAYLMNEKARDLGMSHSHFVNPHGLDQPGHYSSANDLAKLAAYALKNPEFQEIVKTQVKKVPDPSEQWDRVWSNKNKMLAIYPGADGVKTGYTKIAKRCLVSSATRNGQQFAVVTLNDPDDWIDHARLLDYGFSQYPLRKLVDRGEKIEGGFAAGRSFLYPLKEQEVSQVIRQIEWQTPGQLSQRLGLAGTIKVLVDGQQIGSVPIYPENSPLLKQAEDSTASYQTSGVTSDSGKRSFWQELRKVIRALFADPAKPAE